VIFCIRRTILRAFVPLIIIAYFLPVLTLRAQVPELVLEGGNTSDAGHVRLTWELVANREVEVQQSTRADFSDAFTVYRGYEGATFLSGFDNGTYYFRARAEGGGWSEPVSLTVSHHSLRLAFFLFGVGAIVFLLTVLVVVKGARQSTTHSP
jgi:hypothetical protein